MTNEIEPTAERWHTIIAQNERLRTQLPDQIRERIAELEGQRDELLAACKVAERVLIIAAAMIGGTRLIKDEPVASILAQIKAAIAAVEEWIGGEVEK